MTAVSGGSSLLAYSVRSAARALDISPRQVWRLLAAGELRAVKLGRRTVIRRGELVRYMRTLPGYEPPPVA